VHGVRLKRVPPGGTRLASLFVYTGTIVFDLLLPDDSRSLKAKRSYVRPIVAALRRLEVSVAEVGALDLHGRAEIGAAVVAAGAEHVREVLDSCERLIAGRPETELLSVRRRLYGEHDEGTEEF
jgi:uncharacterized protein YlxP (DUF503 family)